MASRWLSGKESACYCRRCMFDTWVGKSPWRRKWQPTPVFLPEKSYGQRGHNWVTKHVPLCVCVCVCHIFNHWSVHGQLGCFHITRVCMCLFKLVFFFFFSDMYLEVKLLDHMIVLFLVFWGPSILFPTVVAPVYIPTNSVQEFSVGFIFKPFVGWGPSVTCRPNNSLWLPRHKPNILPLIGQSWVTWQTWAQLLIRGMKLPSLA